MVALPRALAAAALAALLPGIARSAGPQIEKRALTSRGKPRAYYLFVPSGVSAERPAPMIVTLHGSGRDGRPLLQKWKGLAEKKGFVLAGPDSIESERWASPEDGPLFLRDVVEDVRARHPIDGSLGFMGPRRAVLLSLSVPKTCFRRSTAGTARAQTRDSIRYFAFSSSMLPFESTSVSGHLPSPSRPVRASEVIDPEVIRGTSLLILPNEVRASTV